MAIQTGDFYVLAHLYSWYGCYKGPTNEAQKILSVNLV